MNYEWAKEKLIKNKLPRINPNARKALLNNVKLQEGEQAANALDIETRPYFKGLDLINHTGNRVAFSPSYAHNYENIKWTV
jgi:hypothetical protein